MKLAITPVAAPRMTQRDRWKKRPVVIRYHAYRDYLRACASQFSSVYKLDLTFHMPMPKSWSKKKKAHMHNRPHQSRPDIDNLVKAVFDALMSEDKGVWAVKATKRWSQFGGEVQIKEMDADTTNQLES